MPFDVVRFATFLAGLGGFRLLESVTPDHAPTVPRRQRWIANLGLAALNGGLVSAVCAACAVTAAVTSRWGYEGPLAALALPYAARLAVEVLLLDLLVYLLHRAYHRVPVLWRLHRVHHTDLDLDVSSASRFHVGEVLVSGAAKLAFVAALGISPSSLVAFEVVMLLAAQLQHANLRLPERLDRILWLSFVPPSMHRLHHSPEPADTNSNYGTIVTAWDRLFRTLNRRHRAEAVFGLAEWRDERRLGFAALLRLPLLS